MKNGDPTPANIPNVTQTESPLRVNAIPNPLASLPFLIASIIKFGVLAIPKIDVSLTKEKLI